MAPDWSAGATASTRDRLLRAAEYLFARRGLDVTVKDIHALAGQRNASALHYHFGNKDGLLAAIIDKHCRNGQPMLCTSGPRVAVATVVERHSIRLATPDGRDFERLAHALHDRVALPDLRAEVRLFERCQPELPDTLATTRARAGHSLIRSQVAERARLIDDGPRTRVLADDEFVTNLVDMATAVLTAPSSCEAVDGP